MLTDCSDFCAVFFVPLLFSLPSPQVVTITLLLLNLFIATMGSTFEIINEQSEKQWHLERARIIFAIEREMTSAERHEGDNKSVDKRRKRSGTVATHGNAPKCAVTHKHSEVLFLCCVCGFSLFSSSAQRYWTTVNGERFLQVLEVNPNHFPKDATAAAWEAAEAAKKEEADG
jgi:hypothetical protein